MIFYHSNFKKPEGLREFSSIKGIKLKDAIVNMLNELNISGSIIGEYNLYRAIFEEQKKAKKYERLSKKERN